MTVRWQHIGAALCLASLAIPAAAQPPLAAAPDPARFAAARPVIDRLWPLGTYKRMMDATMNGMMKGMMDRMFDMPVRDLAEAAGATKNQTATLGDSSVSDLARAHDPHFKERMDIMMKVMLDEMTGLMTKMEPQVRDGLTRAYARHFTVAQLNDLSAFFATPSGSAYAAQSMTLMTDPEMMKDMQSFVPELLKALPAIMAKAQAATAHLPPPAAKTP